MSDNVNANDSNEKTSGINPQGASTGYETVSTRQLHGDRGWRENHGNSAVDGTKAAVIPWGRGQFMGKPWGWARFMTKLQAL